MKVKTMQAIPVVAGILVRDGKIMISRRPAGAHMGMKWEFPGGKIETGEAPEDALRRELMEETGAEVEAVGIPGEDGASAVLHGAPALRRAAAAGRADAGMGEARGAGRLCVRARG